MKILVINSGSSSLKYLLFDMANGKVTARGVMEQIGEPGGFADHAAALTAVVERLRHGDDSGARPVNITDLAAVGHRVVHGGEHFVKATIIDDTVEQAIESLTALAPLHNPPNLAGIRGARRAFPDIPHVAVFDTAFHQTMPPRAFLYGLPYEYYKRHGIRRYGFHGTSHACVARAAAEFIGCAPDRFNAVTCHLGNGCSMAAIRNGESIDTSMGLTPLEGLMMGTRSGDIDPALCFFLPKKAGIPFDDMETVLNKQSGLLGVSGVSNDFRALQQAAIDGNARARLAMDMFAYRIRKYLGAYLAVLDGCNAVVFTGGIGEHQADIRALICDQLSHLGIVMDRQQNAAADGRAARISHADSPITVLVIPTNEELEIARQTRAVVNNRQGNP